MAQRDELQRGFKGVWIPKEIWLDDNLSKMEMCLLVEIDSLDNENGCYASNKHFAKFLGISKGRCSQLVSSLNSKGYIQIKYIREGKEIKKRIIKVVSKLNRGVVRKLNAPSKFSKQGYLENAKESNTKSSNTKISNTEKIMSGKPDDIPYSDILNFMNETFGTSYRAKGQANQKLIRGRWNEGFSLVDFKLVIADRFIVWHNDQKMSQYLRPSTVFGASKFEGYLEQARKRKDIRAELAAAKQDQLHEEEMPF